MRRIFNLILDLLFPRRCPCCGKISRGICGDCRKKLPYVRQPYCYRCGKPLMSDEEEYCGACQRKTFAWMQGRALYRYAEPVRSSLHAVKYRNRREYLEYYAQDMERHLGKVIRAWKPEVIIPVPMHPSARRKRGYNQAEILAQWLGRYLHLPVRTDVLKKVRRTFNQKELDYRARRRNLQDAFAAVGAFERVLLVDDVYTSGSTIQEAAKALQKAGSRQIYFVTLCIVPEGDL